MPGSSRSKKKAKSVGPAGAAYRVEEDDAAWLDGLSDDPAAVDKFSASEIQDKGFLAVFIVHLAVIAGVNAVTWRRGNEAEEIEVMEEDRIQRDTALVIYACSAVASFVFSLAWILLMRKFVESILKVRRDARAAPLLRRASALVARICRHLQRALTRMPPPRRLPCTRASW